MKSTITFILCLSAALAFGGTINGRRGVVARSFTSEAGGGPTLIASDDFDSYANNDDLNSAANWVTEGGTFNVSKPAADGSITGGDSNAGLCRHTGTFGADQRAEITIDAAAAGGSFDWVGPAVRIQTGANTGYAVVFSAGDLYLISINAGTQATIISDTGMTLTAGNKVAIECAGVGTSARLKVQIDTGGGWVDKWTNQNPAVDIDGGSAGLGKWLLSTTVNRPDDWAGYDL